MRLLSEHKLKAGLIFLPTESALTKCCHAKIIPWLALAMLASGCATTQTPKHSALASISPDMTTSAYREEANQGYSSNALKKFYQRWAGTPYRYGGTTQSGVDCSSFVRQAISATDDFHLPRTTVKQARVGTRISRASLERGDLVFFRTGRRSHHVGIYLGGGRFMHSSSSQGVTISSLDNSYWRSHYWQSRRLPSQQL